MKRIIHFIISLLQYVIPKSDKVLVFNSFPDFTDNAYALYKYLCNSRGGKYRYIWIFTDKSKITKHPDIKAYYKYSIQAFFYFFRARYVFSTHGIYDFINLRKGMKRVCLWHGMPLKTIGCMDAKNGGVNNPMADCLIATSPFFKEIMAKSFNDMPRERVFLTGQPRNDMFFEQTDFFKNRGIDATKYSSIGMWLPTYRQSIIGDIRVDGVYNANGISYLSMDELKALDDFLKKTGALLIVKLHPMDALQLVDFDKFSNLMIVKPAEFTEQLYPLLGAADYLLTDFSSVWIDYCMLKRPIGFVMNDVDEYRSSRGLTIDNLDEKLPGQIIDSFDKLLDFISSLPEFKDKYMELYNTYCDNKASERLADCLGI